MKGQAKAWGGMRVPRKASAIVRHIDMATKLRYVVPHPANLQTNQPLLFIIALFVLYKVGTAAAHGVLYNATTLAGGSDCGHSNTGSYSHIRQH
jgi:hypothetical protein